MLDEHIDDVARMLTEGPVPDRLAGRVLARIGEDEWRARQSARFWIWSLRVGVPAMVIPIVVAGALWSARRSHQAPDRPSSPASAVSRSGGAVPPPHTAGLESKETLASQGPSAPLLPPREPNKSSLPAPEVASSGAPAPTGEGMDAIQSLALAPLALERIHVAALDRPDATREDPIWPEAIAVAPAAVPRLTVDSTSQE